MLKRLTVAAAMAFALAGGTAHAQYFDVTKVPQPASTGKQIVDDIDAFANDFRLRITGTPIEMNAAAWLAENAAPGFTASVEELEPGRRAVIATRKGTTKPDEEIIFIGHYDILPQSNTAHYDNGSGTLMLNHLSKAFAAIPTNRTVTIAWYNGEEEGALASDVMAKAYAAAKTKVRAVIGMDMVGISWPVATPKEGTTCLCMWWGDEDEGFEALLKDVNYNKLGFPEGDGLVQVVGANDRNSDEASWDAAGFPTLRWAGMRTAGSYPQYHMPQDDLATMEATAGGRDFLEKGMRNTLVSIYNTALALDNEMPVAKVAASGERTITFDGSGSSDPDGPVGAYTWDFGDGTTGSGPKVDHSFAKPGNYVVKMDVADNLHPTVTSTAIVPVSVGKPPVVTCQSKAKAIKNAKKRKAALRKCAKAACTKKAKRIKNAKKRKAALRRCARK
jgi:hypothetical protein